MSDRDGFERERLISLIISVGMMRRDVAVDVTDAILKEHGKLIHKAAGVLSAASMATTYAERHPPRSKLRRELERLSDDLRDIAWELRQQHDRLSKPKVSA